MQTEEGEVDEVLSSSSGCSSLGSYDMLLVVVAVEELEEAEVEPTRLPHPLDAPLNRR